MTLAELLESVRRVAVRTNRPKCSFLDTGGGNWLKWLGENTFSNQDRRRTLGGNDSENGGKGFYNRGRHRKKGGNVPAKGVTLGKLGAALEKMGAAVRELGATAEKLVAQAFTREAALEKMGVVCQQNLFALRINATNMKTLRAKFQNHWSAGHCPVFAP